MGRWFALFGVMVSRLQLADPTRPGGDEKASGLCPMPSMLYGIPCSNFKSSSGRCCWLAGVKWGLASLLAL